MNEAAAAGRTDSLEREWWLRTLLVLQSPRAVFHALRDDSTEAAEARAEPMLAIVFLGGIAAVLATGTAARLLDYHDYDGLLIAVWALIAGGIYGAANYWVLGGAVYLGARGAGGIGSYRRARHLLGLAATPLVLWLLVVWPVRLALYRGDIFRRGGADEGSSRYVFAGLGLVFLAWVAALLLVGMRTVHGWTWVRSAAALSLAAVFLCLFALLAALT